MKTFYELKWFNNSKNPELLKALKLYVENIEPAFRTDTKEIIYWIDNYSVIFDDRFFILGFYKDGFLIGFSELAYFTEERILVVDYLVIDEQFRKNNTFYEFLNKIEEFIFNQNLTPNYIVAEVGCYFEGEEPPENSRNLIRLLKMSRFGVIKAKYYVPRLGINNFESEMIAVLMLYNTGDIKYLKKETFLMIVSTIYFKYYKRWYDVFMNDSQKKNYLVMLNLLVDKVHNNLKKNDKIEINGYSNLWNAKQVDTKLIRYSKSIRLFTLLLITIICFVGIGSLTLYIQKKFGIDINSQSSVFTLSLIIVLFISSLLFEKKSNFFSNLLENIIDKF